MDQSAMTAYRAYSQRANPFKDQPQGGVTPALIGYNPPEQGGFTGYSGYDPTQTPQVPPQAPVAAAQPKAAPTPEYATQPQASPNGGQSLENMLATTQLRGGGSNAGGIVGSLGGGIAGTIGGAVAGKAIGGVIGSALGPVGSMIGSTLGGLAGKLFNKHAASAPTDVSYQDAAKIIGQAIYENSGQPPQPGEVEQIMAGMGAKGQWVGSQGLQSVLAQLKSNSQIQQAAKAKEVNAQNIYDKQVALSNRPQADPSMVPQGNAAMLGSLLNNYTANPQGFNGQDALKQLMGYLQGDYQSKLGGK